MNKKLNAFEQLLRDSANTTQVPETLAKYADALVKGTHEITSMTIRRKSNVLDRIIDSWQELEETMGHLRDENDVEGRMQISVIKKAWEDMDDLVREAWDERGKL
jgi:plasmid maintenance system antidote protein VapI